MGGQQAENGASNARKAGRVMLWMFRARQSLRSIRSIGGRLALSLVAVAVTLSAMTGCAAQVTLPGSPNGSPASSLHFTLDGNFLTANNVDDLRYSIVALGASDGHVAWRHALEGSGSGPASATGAPFQPVYRDGQVYLGYYYADTFRIHHGAFEALDATTGAARWRREIGTEPAGPPVVDGSTVYASALVAQESGNPGTVTGLLDALDAQTGKARWERTLDATPSMATAADGRVYVLMREQFSGHLLALDARDGSVIWDYASDAPLSGGGETANGATNGPLVAGGRVYVWATDRKADGTANSRLVALDARNGSVVWQRQTGGIATPPAFNQNGDTLCLSVYSQDDGTSATMGLATSNGATRWSLGPSQDIASGCAASGDIFYLTQRSGDMKTGSVIALDGQSGRQLWKTPTSAPIAAAGLIAPAVSDGVVGVYVVGMAATSGPVTSAMATLRASDGKLLWRHDFAGRPESRLDIEGAVIFNSESGDQSSQQVITAYARDTGARLWSYEQGHL
jgi:outer membrane protein assembly factor BamB